LGKFKFAPHDETGSRKFEKSAGYLKDGSMVNAYAVALEG
jgi:hypothetical protein